MQVKYYQNIIFFFRIILFLLVSTCPGAYQVFAEELRPSPLTITAPETINFDFHSVLTIPITISGTDATVVLCLFSKDRKCGVRDIRNGNLGWHYMNQIDTCIYVSPPYQFPPGDHTIVCDKSVFMERNINFETEIDFYLWAYDHVSAKQPVVHHVMLNRGGG